MKPKVFISVGSNGTLAQQEASESIFHSLVLLGLDPRQMEKNEWSAEQPLRAIKKVIEECDGAVVIAFSRYRFGVGSELSKGGVEQAVSNVWFPTVWNQIEAAISYANGLPLLVIAEKGLRDDGLLEGRYDWKVFWTDFAADRLRSDDFVAFVKSWKLLVDDHASQREQRTLLKEVDPAKMTVAQLLARLSVPQVWALISALLGFVLGVATAAFRVGAGKWPWQ